jgi:glucose/arabinose dehydrogenase
MKKNLLYLCVLTIITFTSSRAQYNFQNAFPNLTFSSPIFLTNAGDGTDRIFVIEQAGKIKVFENSAGATTAKEFLNITDRVSSGGEKGLLGLAFHPDYENNGYFYVNYTNATNTVIARFQVTSNPDSADKNSEFQLLTFAQPYSNHNGGWMGFGPNDGYLYFGQGDGGSGGDPENRAQNITTFLGKILRIDVDGGTPYAIPPTNPFYDSTGNVKKEIYAWGMRNPWRCSFDPVTGWLWAGDVGQGLWEEIDLIENGKNYGWRCYEGTHPYNTSGCNYPEYINPIWEYPHSPECSITGGYVYRGPGVPGLEGKYIYGDYCSSKIWSLEYDGLTPPVNQYLQTLTGSLTSFGVDEQNELYMTSSNGKIYRFSPTVTSVEPKLNPSEYSLEQNYPNPFNPSTIIKYSVLEESEVTIKIYDALGKEIDSITTGIQQKGSYQKTWSAKGYASGIYFAQMNAKSLTSDKTYSHIVKMLYMK